MTGSGYDTKPPFDARGITGPFDFIGDVHGCADELEELLARLGYRVTWSGGGGTREVVIDPPAGRRAVFVGDLVDRGPRTPDALRLVMAMVARGAALCVPGNHDEKFLRWLGGHDVKIGGGLGETIRQLEREPAGLREEARRFFESLPYYYWLEGGRLVVSHGGLKADMIGQMSGSIRSFCLYGDTTGERDEYGLPVRRNWAAEYRGEAAIIYGHTPVEDAVWLNNTLCLDTGCVYGNKLSALRWPEREIVTVAAARVYAERVKPLGRVVAG